MIKRKCISWFISLFLLSIISAADILNTDGTINVRELNLQLQTSGASWIAVENEFTRMTTESRGNFLGNTIPDRALPEADKREFRGAKTFDPHHDWRDISGDNYTTPIRDQSACGSCWAFAVCAVAEAGINIAENMPALDIDLSEQYLVSTCCSHGDCNGGYLYYTFQFLDSDGVPQETCYPYIASNSPCGNRCPNWLSDMRSFGSPFWLPMSASVYQVKAAVLNAPVAAGMEVYDDFFSYSEGVYTHIWGGLAGYHGVVIVGWDDADSCWICKNSWNTWWGESGWFRIKWGECTIEDWICGIIYEPFAFSAGADTTIDLGNDAILQGSASFGSPDRASSPGYDASWIPPESLDDPLSFITVAHPIAPTYFKLTASDLNVSRVDTIEVIVRVSFGVESDYGSPFPSDGDKGVVGELVSAYVDSLIEFEPGRYVRCVGYNIQGADPLCGDSNRVSFAPTGYDTITWLWEEVLCISSKDGNDSVCLMASPNPCNPMAKITFSSAINEHVRLTIIDLSGKIVAMLLDTKLDAGVHEIYWDGSDMSDRNAPAGAYFAVLQIGESRQKVKLLLVR